MQTSARKPVSKIYTFSDLIEATIDEDGTVIGKASLGRAAIGGALFGSAGAVIGALSRNKHKNICNYITVNLTINDFANPLIKIILLNNPTTKDNFIYTQSKEYARKFLSACILIRELGSIENSNII